MELSQAYLKSILQYDPDTGVFTRVKDGAVVGTHVKGYLCITIRGVRYRLHRLAFLYMTGSEPVNFTDHINGITTDNRWCNLRDVSRDENNRNSRMKKTNMSGVNGVHWSKTKMKWTAQIKVNAKTKHIGRFDLFHDAVAARKQAEVEYGYHPNHGRVQ